MERGAKISQRFAASISSGTGIRIRTTNSGDLYWLLKILIQTQILIVTSFHHLLRVEILKIDGSFGDSKYWLQIVGPDELSRNGMTSYEYRIWLTGTGLDYLERSLTQSAQYIDYIKWNHEIDPSTGGPDWNQGSAALLPEGEGDSTTLSVSYAIYGGLGASIAVNGKGDNDIGINTAYNRTGDKTNEEMLREDSEEDANKGDSGDASRARFYMQDNATVGEKYPLILRPQVYVYNWKLGCSSVDETVKATYYVEATP